MLPLGFLPGATPKNSRHRAKPQPAGQVPRWNLVGTRGGEGSATGIFGQRSGMLLTGR